MSDDTLPFPEAAADVGGDADIASTDIADTAGEDAVLPRPRIRWGGVVWGLAFAALAIAGAWIVVDPGRRDALVASITGLEVGGAVAAGLLGLGALLLLAGLVGLLRRAQKALARRG